MKEQNNPHYDKDPRDQEMKAWGWKPNRFGDSYAMPADVWIAKNEKRIIEKYDVNLPKDYSEEPLTPQRALSSALSDCLQIDRNIRHERRN